MIDNLPVPSHVFIGGSEGELAGILEHIARLDTSVRVVVACVTLETFTTAYTLMKHYRNFEAVQVSVSEAKYLTPSSTLMKPKCPVVILLMQYVNIAIHEGRALDVIESLPMPSHVFIGGSEGELAGILEHIARLDVFVRVVAACVTLETFSTLSTLMKPKCPVMILSCNM